jgi:hypothetical protein
MKELFRVRVQYATRQQCCKTHKRPLHLPLHETQFNLKMANRTKYLYTTYLDQFDIYKLICGIFRCSNFFNKLVGVILSLFTYLQGIEDLQFSDIPHQGHCHTLAASFASGIFVTFILLLCFFV